MSRQVGGRTSKPNTSSFRVTGRRRAGFRTPRVSDDATSRARRRRPALFFFFVFLGLGWAVFSETQGVISVQTAVAGPSRYGPWSMVYAPFVNLYFAEQITRTTSISYNLSAYVTGRQQEIGGAVDYSAMLFPYFRFSMNRKDFSMTGSYNLSLAETKTAYPYDIEGLEQISNLTLTASLAPPGLPSFLVQSGTVQNLREDRSLDAGRTYVSLTSLFMGESLSLSSFAGWDRFIDRTNVSDNVPFSDDSINESFRIGIENDFTERLSMNAEGIFTGYQSLRGFDTVHTKNLNYSLSGSILLSGSVSDNLAFSLRSNASHVVGETRVGAETWPTNRTTALGYGVSGVVQFLPSIQSEYSFDASYLPISDLSSGTLSTRFTIRPNEELKCAILASMGYSKVRRVTKTRLFSASALLDGSATPWLDVSGQLEYSSKWIPDQELRFNGLQAKPRVRVTIIRDLLIRELSCTGGYTWQLQDIDVDGSIGRAVVNVLDGAVELGVTRSMRFGAKVLLNWKAEGVDSTVGYAADLRLFNTFSIKAKYNLAHDTEGGDNRSFALNLFWNWFEGVDSSIEVSVEQERSAPEADWDEAVSGSFKMTARL